MCTIITRFPDVLKLFKCRRLYNLALLRATCYFMNKVDHHFPSIDYFKQSLKDWPFVLFDWVRLLLLLLATSLGCCTTGSSASIVLLRHPAPCSIPFAQYIHYPSSSDSKKSPDMYRFRDVKPRRQCQSSQCLNFNTFTNTVKPGGF